MTVFRHPQAEAVARAVTQLVSRHPRSTNATEPLRVRGGLGAASKTSRPDERTMIKYSRRKDMDRDHASTSPTDTNRNSKPMCRVLKRYRRVDRGRLAEGVRRPRWVGFDAQSIALPGLFGLAAQSGF